MIYILFHKKKTGLKACPSLSGYKSIIQYEKGFVAWSSGWERKTRDSEHSKIMCSAGAADS
ncbi:hypothetical protein GCM10011391_08970 [Pullulanibacillus camelliae]|uniref:Uncharacterized protein n=1 Tax=Pullulanibacillus camelliae TaxID=1707096 RepID=A0A8J2VJ89_9BACL|nr:hypothetical protein GCM10011391_08970 [Pullulanibacillus camelliae]